MNKELFRTWYKVLYNKLLNTSYFTSLITSLNNEYKEGYIFPKKKNVFNCFKLTNYNDLRVVVLGKHSYTTKDSLGIPFSNNDNIRESSFSPSLLKIKDCIERDVKDGVYLDFDPTLKNWGEQGVLLLNTSLTSSKEDGDSHRKYWNRFIKNIISIIDDNKSGIIFLLWGPEAREYKKLINNKKHYILEYTSPMYAVNNNIDWKCPHFKEVNKIIEQNNGKEFIINW